jgi:NAD(P)-dependent dehydrogenase (short-subunit alcohol dehydrogenase family)
MGRLQTKVAVITGAATGIGRATAHIYAQEGARVVAADIRAEQGTTTAKSIVDAGGDAVFVHADVTKTDDIQELMRAAESRYGAIHIVTANAGILGPGHNLPLTELSEEQAAAIMNVNFWGVFRCFKQAIDPVRRAGGGAFTATSSIAAIRGYPNIAAYTASKGAIAALVRSLAVEVAPEIRVNAVLAAHIATEAARHYAEDVGRELVSQFADSPPRIGDPREAAAAHLWLVSDEASFVTGQAIVVDNGLSVRAS